MTDLDLDTLEAAARAAAEPAPETFSAAAFGAWALAGREYQKATQPEVTLALLTRLREAEQERDEARWAAGIVGDVARESSGGWQDAAAELHATQARLREAEAVIANVEDFVTRHYLDMRMGQAVLALTDAYKPTNQEGGNDGT